MGQKSQLAQDMFLLGPPGPLKRRLVMTMAELCNWEVEYLHISKDTAESDIKQRREVLHFLLIKHLFVLRFTVEYLYWMAWRMRSVTCYPLLTTYWRIERCLLRMAGTF